MAIITAITMSVMTTAFAVHSPEREWCGQCHSRIRVERDMLNYLVANSP